MQAPGELLPKRGWVGAAQTQHMPGLWVEGSRATWGEARSVPWHWPPFLASVPDWVASNFVSTPHAPQKYFLSFARRGMLVPMHRA